MSATEPPGIADAMVIPGSETGLPWTIALAPGDTSDLVAEFSGRRRLVFIGLTATLLLLAGGTYFVWHVLRRELAVSCLQTEFVAAVSHEFRTPLTSLRHVTELLDEHDDVPVDRRRQFYGTLARNTDRLQRLVESLLDFSRMESGRQAYDLRPIDASELVRQVIDDFRAHGKATGPSVAVEPAADVRCPIQADSTSLSTAIWNLLDNAVKYSPNGGAIVVRTERRPGSVAIAVRDQGIGIPLRERRDVFDRFVRGAGVASLGIKGTGLGLALVAHIVRGHGGTIELESDVGAGSTFTIVLPSVRDTAVEPVTHGTSVAARRSS